ncbi:glycoside hydrolase family 20 protein [Nocardia sp. SYP-A9097]|uniref:beta-N-acetylhexosaminidase n=1 Tax=Nocardia sp. SYP-A9097 TaxID=2663237 RepID=UPI001E505F1B|nr:glycoside hydrolase family 20 protein [Nocardia sp. SYP-A9097]
MARSSIRRTGGIAPMLHALGRTHALGAVALSLTLGAALLTTAPSAYAEADATLPITVPSVHEFAPGTGSFTLPDQARIVASGAAAPIAARFATDLNKAGRTITEGDGAPGPGDLVLRIDQSGPDQPESYRIDIGATVTATARTAEGAIHATQTLLQWFSRTGALPTGTVTDWPDYSERGLLLDLGRKYLTVDWIEQRIREMAYYRMNLIQLHFSDRYGFRLESRSHPEVTSPEHYSRAEIAEIIAYAADYGIEVMPEIGFPGHMNGILESHPELALHPVVTNPIDAATDGLLAGTAEGRIDLSDPGARPLIEDLLREFLPLFPGRYFHIGGDEYISDYSRYPQIGEDLVADTFNWANGIVRSYGKTARMWNDGIPRGGHTPVDRSIIVDYWTGGDGPLPWISTQNGPESLADQGFTLSNAGFTPTYWSTGGYAAPLNSPPELLYAWDPGLFVNGTRLRPDQRGQLLGSKLFIFADDPFAKTEQEIVEPVHTRLPIMAQQLWAGTKSIGYGEFTGEVRMVGLPTS